MKPSILFLVHRIPFPPNKGDKIRSFHMLRYLAQRYRVHLATFVDDPDDWQYVSQVETLCADLCALKLHRTPAKVRSLSGLWLGEPLSLSYYKNQKLQKWIRRKLSTESLDAILVFSSTMAQYIDWQRPGLPRTVVDFVDMDSEKWRQFAQSKHGLWKWLFTREADTLAAFENATATAAAAGLFVSAEEAASFRERSGLKEDKIIAVENGVDTDYFAAAASYPDPYGGSGPVMVFTGAMDYWPNIDAVTWFARDIFPAIRQAVPHSRFCIVGSHPTREVEKLGAMAGVSVTGRVPDVRPYLAHAALAVAPMRIGRGIQNKVLEAMAMAKPVLTTALGAEGVLDHRPQLSLRICSGPQDWVNGAVDMLRRGDVDGLGRQAEQYIKQRFAWDRSLAVLDNLLTGSPALSHVS